MSVVNGATEVVGAVTSRRLSAQRVRERQAAMTPRGKTLASNGKIVAAEQNTQAPPIKRVPAPTTD